MLINYFGVCPGNEAEISHSVFKILFIVMVRVPKILFIVMARVTRILFIVMARVPKIFLLLSGYPRSYLLLMVMFQLGPEQQSPSATPLSPPSLPQGTGYIPDQLNCHCMCNDTGCQYKCFKPGDGVSFLFRSPWPVFFAPNIFDSWHELV